MRAVKIPVDASEPISVIGVGSDWRSMAAAIGGPCEYIERVRCPLTLTHNLVVVVDENGIYDGQPTNPRAWSLYPIPGYQLHGTVLVMAEGMTKDGPDFIDLPDPDLALRLVETVVA